MKKKIILAPVILFFICTNLFSQTDSRVKCFPCFQIVFAVSPSLIQAGYTSWAICSPAVNIKNNTAKGKANIVHGIRIKTIDNCVTTCNNVFFYAPLVIIYTIGQLLLLFFIIYERRYKNKNNPADIFIIVDGRN